MSRRKRPRSSRKSPPVTPPEPTSTAGKPRALLAAAAALAVALVVAAVVFVVAPDGEQTSTHTPGDTAPLTQAEFVGSAACASCHAEAYADWESSQHAMAMQRATPETVQGDFSGTTFSADGVTTSFLRRDDRFLVHTVGIDGAEGEFEVRYTFGVDPLQQYLIELEGGRVQPLTVAWDAREETEGGQRWMTLYPGEQIDHTDELHWTGRQQNWNFMCADCHSTNLQKNYDRETDTFATTWSEINVGCESCHGPGSEHLAWAAEAGDYGQTASPTEMGLTAALDERRGVSWTIDPETYLPQRSEPRMSQREIGVCAQCHSRRSQIAEGYVAGASFYDHYLPAPLTEGLYHADGQQRDEVFIWGSFLQSRMFAAGVTCADCHNPHSQELRAPGNAVCAQCHTPPRYDTPEHHFHPVGSEGAACVSCHMREETYMRIDPRRDHSFRVPRPDQTVSLGVPNACNDCHTGESAEWAANTVREWYGDDPAGYQTFAVAFVADERGEAGATDALAALARDRGQPAIVRASALARLVDRPSLVALEAARVGLTDPDPLARRQALEVLEALPPGERVGMAGPLLSDPTRIVRMHAAWLLAPAAQSFTMPALRDAFTRASDEFIESQRYLSDRPESRVTLGTYFAQLGRAGEAEAEYRAAIRMRPAEVAAYVNLADLHRARGREGDAEALLREGLEILPEAAPLHHALGLSLARSQRIDEAIESLARAADLAPEEPRYTYAYAVALNSSGASMDAVRVLEHALERHSRDYDLLYALATFHRDAGRVEEARRYAVRLRDAHPGDPTAEQLLRSLE